VHPRAIAVAHRHGLALDATGTAHLADVAGDDDVVIAVCDNAYEELTGGHTSAPVRTGAAVRPRLHWSIPDPVRVGTDAAFEAAYTDLARRVERLAPALIPATRKETGHA